MVKSWLRPWPGLGGNLEVHVGLLPQSNASPIYSSLCACLVLTVCGFVRPYCSIASLYASIFLALTSRKCSLSLPLCQHDQYATTPCPIPLIVPQIPYMYGHDFSRNFKYARASLQPIIYHTIG
jgi:hypothetical protein